MGSIVERSRKDGSKAFVAQIVIKKAGVTQTVTTDYTISSSGLVTFTSAPANGAALTWTGEFDLPMRFDTDHLPVIMNENDLAEIDSIPIREVIGET